MPQDIHSHQSSPEADWSSATEDLLDTLPKAWTRGLLYVVLMLIAVMLPWSFLYRIDQTAIATGRLEPKGGTLKPMADIPHPVTVVEIPIREGQAVKAGQVLMKLDAQRAQEELNFAQAQLNSVQGVITKLQRIQNPKNVQLEIAIANQQTELTQLRGRVQSLKQQLDDYVIRSPVDGVVLQLPIHQAGSVIQPHTVVAEIAPQQVPLVFKGQTASAGIAVLQYSQTKPVAQLKLDENCATDCGVLEGHLAWISPTTKAMKTGEGTTHDLEIEFSQSCLQVSNRCVALKPGQAFTAEITLQQRRGIDLLIGSLKK